MTSAQQLVSPACDRLPAVDSARPWDPSWQPPWLVSRLNEVSRWDRRPQIPTDMALTDQMRALISGRIEALERLVQPATERERTGIAAALLAFYSTSKEDEISVRAKLSVWVQTLEGLPHWALQEAVRRWHAGRLKADTSFCPSPAEILRAAELVVGGVRGQVVTMRRLLAAEPIRPISDDERERVADKLRAFAEEMRGVGETLTRRTAAPPLQPGGGDGDTGLGTDRADQHLDDDRGLGASAS